MGSAGASPAVLGALAENLAVFARTGAGPPPTSHSARAPTGSARGGRAPPEKFCRV